MNTATAAATEIIEPGTEAYTHRRVFVHTFHGVAYALTAAQLAGDLRVESYADVDRPVHTYHVTDNGDLRPTTFKSKCSPFDSDDYATVTVEILDAETQTVIARLTYSLDGRA